MGRVCMGRVCMGRVCMGRVCMGRVCMGRVCMGRVCIDKGSASGRPVDQVGGIILRFPIGRIFPKVLQYYSTPNATRFPDKV
jgi:hypothetical protein